MRIHGVRLIAVRMSPSRRCQTSWRARPTTADADVGIEGTDDALAETRHASHQHFFAADAVVNESQYSVYPLERIWFYSCGDVVGELELVRLDGCGEGASQLLWRINGLTG